MNYNKLLKRQINKWMPPDLASRADVEKLLAVISDSYNSFEKDIEHSDRAFRISEEEYIEINEKLAKEIDNKNRAYNTLKETIGLTSNLAVEDNDVDLPTITEYVKDLLIDKKNAETIFTSLIDNINKGIILINSRGIIIYTNSLFCENFNIQYSPQEIKGKKITDFIRHLFKQHPNPGEIYKLFKTVENNKELVSGQVIKTINNRNLEIDYVPIFSDDIYYGTLWKVADTTEWNKTLENLSETESAQHLLLNTSINAILILDEKWQVTSCNHEAENIFGCTAKMMKECNFLDAILQNSSALKTADSENQKYPELNKLLEVKVINKRNEILNIELFIVPIHQRDQDMYWCFIRDITEKIQAEANLIHSQRMLNQSQEIANIGSWELDINMGKMSWTDELYKIRGLVPQQQEVDNDLLFYYTHPDDRAMLKTVIQQTLKEKIPYNINYRIVRADGTIRVLQDIGQPILDDSGRVIKLQGFEKDITEIVRVSEEIEMQKRFTEVVLNNLPADIAVFDPGHHYRFINPNGIKNDELRKWMIGKTDFDYCELKNIDTGIAEKRRDLFNEAIQTKTTVSWVDEHKNKEGSRNYILRKFYPYFEEEELKYVFGYGVDITERKEIENKLNETLVNMKSINKELERFAFVASHDLQEPLRMVSSFLDLLQLTLEDKMDENSKRYIHFAIDGAERMRKLIQDLLEYSKLGFRLENVETTDLNEVITYVMQVLNDNIVKKNAVVIVHPMPQISANKIQISQLFLNLISNALKYSNATNPTVEVGYSDDATHWVFYIKDNGIGIDPVYFDKIFELFQRLHGKSEYSGTGIGLSICKKIVELYNGKIWVESEVGKGSTFYFTIQKIDL